MRDIHHDMSVQRVISPVALGTTGTGKTGKIIDRKGYESIELIVSYGSVTATNAVVTLLVKEGDVTGTMTSVADADLISLEATAGLAAAATRTSGTTKNVSKRIGYIGNKRYITASLVNTVSAGIVAGIDAVLSDAARRPVAT